MDQLHEYFLHAIHLYHSADPYLRPIRSSFREFQMRTIPLIMPYLDALANYAANSPAILVIGSVIVLFLVARVVIGWIWRAVLFWLRFAFWSAMIMLIALAWQRGFERTGEDLGRWAQGVGQFWWEEYEKFEGYQKQHQFSQGRGHRNGGSWR
ncbi:hypothetical protein B0O99DRAFT_689548 [Bisporella sp. PMI_857]|jgi:hypothetical protein|nr:hypothetical protein B0O99DRAFT_689548 [Bisporella sp. PMI_857]